MLHQLKSLACTLQEGLWCGDKNTKKGVKNASYELSQVLRLCRNTQELAKYVMIMVRHLY